MFSSSRIRKSVVICLVLLFSLGSLVQAQAKPARADLLDFVPADSLFCVRINNLDKALGLVDEYIAGLSPMPIPLSMMARMPLAQLLGDPTLKNIKTNGDFAIFGVICPSQDKPDEILVAGFIPVTDYAEFVGENANCSEPDDKGVSKISAGNKKILITKVGSYALLGPENSHDELVAVAGAISKDKAKSLASVLGKRRARAAGKAPFWAYGNVQSAGKAFGPFLFAQIEKGAEQLKKMEAQQGFSPAEVMDMYVEMLKVILDEVDTATLSATPGAEALKLSVDVSAVKGKPLAKMLTPSKSPEKRNTLLPYLDDDAMMNLAMKINKPLWTKMYDRVFDVLGVMSKGSISAEDMAKLKKLTYKELESFGDSLAFSMSASSGAKPPFAMTYAIEIADQAAYEQTIKESMEVMNSGAIGDIYKSMGMKLDFEIKQGTAEYKGVSIDSARLQFKSTEPDSDMAKAIEAMYGEGFDYRWAIVDGLALIAISPDVDAEIRKLIDEVKAGGRKKLGKETKAALALLPGAQRADFVGTINYVRMMKMGIGMAKAMGPEAGVMPEIDVPTESNIAFSGRIRRGRIHKDVVIPKKHLVEIKAAIEQITAGVQKTVASKKKGPAPTVEKVKTPVVAEGAKVEKLADGFSFTEGPAADTDCNVFFSDIPNNKVHKFSSDGKVSVHRDNTGGANGLYFDKKGNLLACAGGDRQVVSISLEGKVTVLADKYDGKKLNSPNDLWIDPKGGIYFTDPRYGRNRDDMEQDGEHVYYILPGSERNRKIIRVVDDMVRPNGVIGTCDGKKLYIADHGGGKTWVYKINEDGTLSDKKLFAEEGSDGMTIDNEGNIYLTNDAVKVYCCPGNKIATIEVPERPANVTFGGPGKQILFITAQKSLYSIAMRVKGL